MDLNLYPEFYKINLAKYPIINGKLKTHTKYDNERDRREKMQ